MIASALFPHTATECVGWMLRTTPGDRRNTSVRSPILDTVRRTSKTGSPSAYSTAVPRNGIGGIISAFDSFLGFQGGPVDVIRTLREVVGARGTLMMPAIPFRGTAVEYALGDPVFDVRRTVSRMGLLTEVFR